MSSIAEMDRNGPAWCRANLPTIVGWLREEFDRRRNEHQAALECHHRTGGNYPRPADLPLLLRLPFSPRSAKALVIEACRRAMRTAK